VLTLLILGTAILLIFSVKGQNMSVGCPHNVSALAKGSSVNDVMQFYGKNNPPSPFTTFRHAALDPPI